MINSFGTGKPTDAGGKADGEENGSGSSGSGGFGMPGSPEALLPWRAASGAMPPSKEAGAGAAEAMSLFSCAVFFAAVACRRQRLKAIPGGKF